MMEEPPIPVKEDTAATKALADNLRKLAAEEQMTPEDHARCVEKAEAVAKGEKLIEVNGIPMTRSQWRQYMEDCPHEHFEHPGVKLMDGSEMSICTRCKLIQHTPIAKMIEREEF